MMAPEETMNVILVILPEQNMRRRTDRVFIIAGGNNSIYEGWLVKTDQDGKKEWNRTFKGN